ncbi:hypothetical protein OSTOST_09493 [Ostertagia ostertagi]
MNELISGRTSNKISLQNRSLDKGNSSNELGDVSLGSAPQEQAENVNQSSREEIAGGLPEMDDKDVAEMSMIVAQIEGAEDFNLTLETVDTSEYREQSHEETRPKSRQSKKEISPLYKSDQEGIEMFLEEGMNESMSVVEEAKINVSLADSLLNEWATPVTKRKRSLSERTAEDHSESNLLTSTPAGRLKSLQQFFPDSGKFATSSKKRVSTSSDEGHRSPMRKRRASISENEKRSRSKSFSKVGITSPSHSMEKSRVTSKHPLKTRNM